MLTNFYVGWVFTKLGELILSTVKFAAIFHKEFKCFDILFAFIYTKMSSEKESAVKGNTVFDLIAADTPISAQSSHSVVFKLQPVYLLSTSLERHILLVPI